MSRSFFSRPRLDQATVTRITDFLFGKKELTESQYLDMRSDIKGRDVFSAIVYYRILNEYYGCESARVIADLLERLSVSSSREGRSEAVAVLCQNLPKETVIPTGVDSMISAENQ